MKEQKLSSKPSKISPSAPSLIDPGILISNTWNIYKTLWKQLLILSILPYLSLIPLGLLVILFFIGGFFAFNAHHYLMMVLIGTLGVITTLVYLSLSFSLGSIAMIYIVSKQGKISVKEALMRGWHKVWAYWMVSFIVGILVFGGYLFFIVPGFVFSVWFTFSTYIVVLENISGMDAILRSREYVRNRFWGVLGRVVLMGLLISIIVSIPGIILNFAGYKQLGGALQWVFQIILTPVGTIYLVSLFEDVKKLTPTVEPPAKNTKYLYMLIAVLGFIILICLLYFGLTYLVSLLQHMKAPQSPASYV